MAIYTVRIRKEVLSVLAAMGSKLSTTAVLTSMSVKEKAFVRKVLFARTALEITHVLAGQGTPVIYVLMLMNVWITLQIATKMPIVKTLSEASFVVANKATMAMVERVQKASVTMPFVR